jgi:hypothetical protein
MEEEKGFYNFPSMKILFQPHYPKKVPISLYDYQRIEPSLLVSKTFSLISPNKPKNIILNCDQEVNLGSEKKKFTSNASFLCSSIRKSHGHVLTQMSQIVHPQKKFYISLKSMKNS